MSVSSTKFQSISNLTAWFVRVSIATIILAIINRAHLPFVLNSDELNSPWNNLLVVEGGIIIIITILVVVMTLLWYYRATRNIHSFGAKHVTSSKMAVIWWFIPIANLWKPYKIAQQIWKASNPEIKLSNGTEWRNTPSSNIIRLWWTIGLVSILGPIIAGSFIGITLALIYEDADEELVEQFINSNQITIIIPFSILAIISTIYFIRMIRVISYRQELKSGTSI